MNVIISNELQSVTAGLDIEIIKSLNGQFEVDELISMFSNFYFGRMILDITSIRDFKNLQNLQKLSMSLDVEKIIILLPATDQECTANAFLSQLISMGIYNFTTNLEGINYLLQNPNTYRDVAHIHQVGQTMVAATPGGGGTVTQIVTVESGNGGPIVIGFKNITDHAGATSLIYMLLKEAEARGISACAIEVNRRDFPYFGSENMFSVSAEAYPTEVMKHKEFRVMFVDLNDSNLDETCNQTYYLIEPSTLKLNKLMRRDMRVFEKLRGKSIIINKSLLTRSDIEDFEYESKTKIFYNVLPLNDKIRNKALGGLLEKMGIVVADRSSNSQGEGTSGGGLFGLFKRN